MSKYILGIESSCDDTSIALVARDGTVAQIETVSQYEVHAPHGGVFPELASRAHLEAILPTVERVMDGITPADLVAIGVTRGPGLIGSLLVGLSTAQGLGLAWDLPVIGVNHLRGHIRSVGLEGAELEYPALIMLASGGHTLIAHAKSPSQMELIGTTRDDSVGECYDKVARMMGFGMPGGPEIDKAAARGKIITRFPRPMKAEGYEFSFSGLKSSVARFLEKTPDAPRDDVAASFVAACLDVLGTKLARAIEEFRPQSVALVGGVAASAQIRTAISDVAEAQGVALHLPPIKWSTDNGAMIALAAWDYFDQGIMPPLEPIPGLPLGTM